ncbi:hypothetical protein FRT60_17920 [Pseudomonas haemolytica]|uniref:Uncharacterized protein n=1 Tax=Pseudomonas haemolytica TaxID=2600065 RepID=A0A646P1F3_9PSED|nr:hypothetical protein [Pseudomonas haemolytica]
MCSCWCTRRWCCFCCGRWGRRWLICRRSCHNAVSVGAGLLANADCQSTSSLTDPPHSRASPLPQFVL